MKLQKSIFGLLIDFIVFMLFLKKQMLSALFMEERLKGIFLRAPWAALIAKLNFLIWVANFTVDFKLPLLHPRF